MRRAADSLFRGERWSGGSADRRTQIPAILLCCARLARSDRNLTAQAKDKLVDFDACPPGGGYLRESLLSRFLNAFGLNSERASALYNERRCPLVARWCPLVPLVEIVPSDRVASIR